MTAGIGYGPVRSLFVAVPGAILAASVAFLLGRTILHDRVHQRIARAPRWRALYHAVETNTLKVILLLRLSPVVPFNMLNYALGLTNVRLGGYVVGCSYRHAARHLEYVDLALRPRRQLARTR